VIAEGTYEAMSRKMRELWALSKDGRDVLKAMSEHEA
jgi:hypothetical protein